ncbi:hypothetical protein [Paraburkholderia rhizosphaerae]|uniref:Uncharacterized protein n=1 Tax=Paraburkholderia rhizosphaerae TaxID=480658 RepID=A0A4R8LRG9_9BURK|nr:hypothetical protein [Paraburkholderia rhizosphaerae]TDY48095.1 hypothetical protein BX592_11129 [Paraburkholderia rhizosphaerae]
MFGLYPAGPSWIRHFNGSTQARELQQLLVKHAGFTAGIFHQPFGPDRGAVVAQKGSFLVLGSDIDAGNPELAVVPDVQTQNLLWSFNTGYANQWSDRELRALTGCTGWDALLRQVTAEFGAICTFVERALDGSLVPPAPQPDPLLSRMLADDDDAPWLPSDYLFDSPMPEAPSCVR